MTRKKTEEGDAKEAVLEGLLPSTCYPMIDGRLRIRTGIGRSAIKPLIYPGKSTTGKRPEAFIGGLVDPSSQMQVEWKENPLSGSEKRAENQP